MMTLNSRRLRSLMAKADRRYFAIMHRMELNHLQTFIVVAEEKSITGAAQRLFTTPSSISVHIKHLEEELGVQLFVRSPRGMQITEKGQVLLDKAHDTLQSVRDLVNQATEMQAHIMGHISIGINATLSRLRIPQLLQKLSQDCPGITPQLKHLDTGQILEQIQQEKLALGFIYGDVDDARLLVEHLSPVQLVVAIPSAWSETLSNSEWEDLAQFPWICSTHYCPFQTLIDKQFSAQDLNYQSVVSTNDDRSKAQLVAEGLGLSLLEISEAQALAAQNKISIWDKQSFSSDLSLVCLSYRQYDPLIEAVLQRIKQIWQ